MAINPTSLGLTFDLTQAESVCKSQRWVLVSMQEFGPALVTVLWRILGNEEDVCDAYQDTFLRLAHLPDQQKPDNVRAYLFRTATNTAISMLRRKQLQKKHQQVLVTERPVPENNPVAELDARQLQRKLRDAIAELPDYLGDVIVLHELAEMPYNQVAKILGIRTAAARVYRHKAIKLLAKWMSQSENREER
ncbi:MAG: RNA polymerase sigma factor [Planctomycetota bacterium]|jgi:RNA polymerase sigma-70 factor (ECF subfamily)